MISGVLTVLYAIRTISGGFSSDRGLGKGIVVFSQLYSSLRPITREISVFLQLFVLTAIRVSKGVCERLLF